VRAATSRLVDLVDPAGNGHVGLLGPRGNVRPLVVRGVETIEVALADLGHANHGLEPCAFELLLQGLFHA
jgi:hypothetical protein